MRPLESIISDPANGNSPEFIAERLGLHPTLVRNQRDVVALSVEDLPILGSYQPEGWTSTEAAVWVPQEMIFAGLSSIALHGMATAMFCLFNDKHGHPVKNAEFGLAVDFTGITTISIRAYRRDRK